MCYYLIRHLSDFTLLYVSSSSILFDCRQNRGATFPNSTFLSLYKFIFWDYYY